MTPLLLAAEEGKEASPIGLVLIVCLLIAVVLLIRSMNKHLRTMRTTFAARDAEGSPGDPAATRPDPTPEP